MDIKEMNDSIISLESVTSERMRRYIHYKSVKNFILHFNEIRDVRIQSKIVNLLSEYFEEIKANNYMFDVYASTDLAKKYLFTIAEYYREDSNFMRLIKLQHVFLYGILIDCLLYFGGILSTIYNIPIITIGFFFYYLFVLIFKEPKGRVYGMFY